MESQPNPNTDEQHKLGPYDRLALAYHGLIARIHERRLDGSSERFEDARRSETFYHNLGRVASETLAENWQNGHNVPPPVSGPKANFLAKQAMYHSGEDQIIPAGPVPFNMTSAGTEGENRAVKKLRDQITELRQGRKDNIGARRMMGNATLDMSLDPAEKNDLASAIQSEYRIGRINDHGLLELEENRGGVITRKIAIHDRRVQAITAPSIMKRAANLTKQQTDIFEALGKTHSEAQKRQQKETDKRQAIVDKLDARRQKQQAILNP